MPVNKSDLEFFNQMQRIMASISDSEFNINAMRQIVKKMKCYSDEPACLNYQDKWITTRDGYQLRLRHYRIDDKRRPAIIYFPGNGFIHDLFTENHSIISKIAKEAGCHAIMVDYRLAPENPYPTPLYDAMDAIYYVFEQADLLAIDSNKIVLAGFSSGANLAAVATNQLRMHPDIHVYHQLLISGAYDYTDSLHEFDHYALQDKMLDPDSAKFSFDCYSKKEQRNHPTCSPYWEPDLSKLPPTTLMMGEYDGGRSQGEGYAKKLIDAGNEVVKIIGKGQTHGTILYRKACFDGDSPAIIAGKRLFTIL